MGAGQRRATREAGSFVAEGVHGPDGSCRTWRHKRRRSVFRGSRDCCLGNRRRVGGHSVIESHSQGQHREKTGNEMTCKECMAKEVGLWKSQGVWGAGLKPPSIPVEDGNKIRPVPGSRA